MRTLWVIAAVFACVVAATQTARMRNAHATALERSQEASLLRAMEAAHEQNVLAWIRKDLETGAANLQFERDAVIVIADTKCAACATAIQAIVTRGATRPILVASFVDDPRGLRDWLRQIGADLPILSADPDSTALRWLPRRITPVYLEFQGFDPSAVHAGEPKEYWMSNGGG